MKRKEKAWREKLKKIENDFNSRKLHDEIKKIEKTNLPAAYIVLLGPGYIYAQIAMRNFLKVKAETLDDKQKYNELTKKIKNLWKTFFISIVFWIIASIAIVNFILSAIFKH